MEKPKPHELAAVFGAIVGVVAVQVFGIPVLSPTFGVIIVTMGLVIGLVSYWGNHRKADHD